MVLQRPGIRSRRRHAAFISQTLACRQSGGESGTNLLLAKAATEEQKEAIGNQTGGRVFLFLHTDDFWRDYRAMRQRGVHFCEEPRHESYGTVAVFMDLYDNRWDLIQLK